ncbi:amidophosphoribosyltransferase [Mesoterricola sediminis]|uniref:Amidophosphoribosyltransferase n=1 Tax=Mesoterricola sediminis TaxID=2927980 RepID=A0AA48GQP6_9BACT|nr:amidophosphoribosyltransferase [Mesoterricola sediminis]BDU77501.1 amidophosphoribosyltransferase [Mesoterricola sediminis]
MAFRDECGVFGIWPMPEASRQAYLGLYALQHRGQEAAGICSRDNGRLHLHKAQGYVADVFSEATLDRLPGDAAIGHTRYSTTGGNVASAAHPFVVEGRFGQIALCHNGNLTNTEILRHRLIEAGQVFSSPSDSEVILALINRAQAPSLEDAVVEALRQVEGAFSVLILTEDALMAARDPHGFRPLAMGRLGEATTFSSETCAFDLLGADYVREVEPGELVVVDRQGTRSRFPLARVQARPCVFEHVYFARPDSLVYGLSVMATRRDMGRLLARRHPVAADLVVPVPDSGVSAALGYSEESGIPFDFGLIRNHYVGRTFIEPRQSIRSFGVKVKLNPVRELLRGKRVVLVDDSVVRGTTSRKIVSMVRAAGAAEVHMRISSPPTTHPCFYGIDTPDREHLLAARMDVEGIRTFIGADSVGYLTLDDLQASVKDAGGESFCYACFTGEYPVTPRSKGTCG